jgi:hypothetical protein
MRSVKDIDFGLRIVFREGGFGVFPDAIHQGTSNDNTAAFGSPSWLPMGGRFAELF